MILITGASRGIGQFLFEKYIEESKEKVMGTYFNSTPSKYTSAYLKMDVTDFEQVEETISSIREKLNQVTLINCAGITYNSFTHKSEPDKWRNVLSTNLFGTYNLIRTLLPIMREDNFGRIINFSSVVASNPTPGVSAYASSKSALWGFTKSVAIENASKNITINNINMGYSELGMISEVPEKFLKSIIQQIPIGKLCPREDIFSTVDFLRKNSYITGTSIDLNGGMI